MSTEAELLARIEALERELGSARQETAAREAELVGAAKLATLGSLIAGLAHELNSPLGALHSNHDVLKRALGKLQVILADEQVDASELFELRRIVRAVDGVLEVNQLAVDRMVEMVTNLRTFGRPDRSDRDTIDLRELLDSTLALLAHKLRDRIEVVRDYQDVPFVDCQPSQVNQVFMNLLVNAAQAIPDRGTITVRTRSGANEAVIEIEDTGTGIEPGNLSRIFEPGFTTKGSRIGMGLGLLIVRQIVDRHQGGVEVQSVPGEGTRFRVRLPLNTDPNHRG